MALDDDGTAGSREDESVSINMTLEHHLAVSRSAGGPLSEAAAGAVAALARGAVRLSEFIELGGLGVAFAGQKGTRNADGDVQKDLDVFADETFLDAIHSEQVALYASEELDNPIAINPGAPLALALDPLDGSSNIDTNLSIGTIFSILPVADGRERMDSFLQPGRKQIAAGFFIYGPQLVLVLTLGKGTNVFVHSPRQQGFVLAYADVVIPARAQEFAINASNYRHWDDAVRHYIDDCLRGVEGAHGRDFNMRWLASLVADAYRILIRGGVFLYPGDSRKGYAHGRLRLVYEANPMAMVIEQAGGLATNTLEPILDIVPQSLHERTPLVFGSASEVEQVGRYHADPEPMGIRSPLFGRRGLFRS
jgi:fructose-1,6-bisphosphatase I